MTPPAYSNRNLGVICYQPGQHLITSFHGVKPMGEPSHPEPRLNRDNHDENKEETHIGLAGAPRRENDKASVDSQLRLGHGDNFDDEGPRPPLPPRPRNLEVLHQLRGPSRPSFQARATTAVSCTDVHLQSFQDGSQERSVASDDFKTSGKSLRGIGSIRRFKGWTSGEGDDSASVRSYAPTVGAGGDVESLLGEFLGSPHETPTWKILSARAEESDPFDSIIEVEDPGLKDFEQEFDELVEIDAEGSNEGLEQSSQKHFYFPLSQNQSICYQCGGQNESISSFCPRPGSRFTADMVMTI